MAAGKIKFEVQPFDCSKTSDREAHEVVAKVVEGYSVSRGGWPYPEIGDLDGGERLLEKDPDWNRRCVLALAEQTAYWWRVDDDIRKEYDEQGEYYHVGSRDKNLAPSYVLIGIREALSGLLRRKLPLNEDDLIFLASTCVEHEGSNYRGLPPAGVQKQAEFFSKTKSIEGELREVLLKLAEYTRGAYGRDKAVASRLDTILQVPGEQSQRVIGAVPKPAPVGSPDVLIDLKVYLGAAEPIDTERVVAEGDRFAMYVDSPLAGEHAAILQAIPAFHEAFSRRRDFYRDSDRDDAKTRKQADEDCEAAQKQVIESLQSSVENQAKLQLAACERWGDLSLRRDLDYDDYLHYRSPLEGIIHALNEREVDFDRELGFDWLLFRSAVTGYYHPLNDAVASQAEAQAAGQTLTDGERWVIHRLRSQAIDAPPMGALPEFAKRLSQLIDDDATLLLVPGEHWADQVHLDLSEMDEESRSTWIELFKLAFTANSSKPSKKWSKQLAPLIESIETSTARQKLAEWFAKVSAGRSFKVLGGYAGDTRGAADTFNEGNATVLRGLVWALVTAADESTPRVVADLLATSIKKVPGVGPRAVKVANACVWVLGELASMDDEAIRINALGQLARLKARVTFKTTLKAIEKALDKAAAESGMPRDEIEEMAVPTYGLEEIGRRSEKLNDFTAELVVTGTTSTELRWLKPDGKPQKSVPKAVKENYADDLKELKAAAKDIEKMLPAQRERIDQLHLKQKTWAYETWRERYLDHPLVGTLARRLIWVFDHGEHQDKLAATWLDDKSKDGKLVDAAGEEVEVNPDSAVVSLWHPIGHDEADIQAWRRFFEEREIKQPFKQAHREIYLLTDAERNTGVYSNRYASHIIKQHQFNALCGVRGWKNSLRLMVDDEYPPSSIVLPQWNLRAEFWVEGVGDEYGTDTNETGTYLYLATDQVRFYSIEAATNYAHAGGGGYGSVAAGPGTGNVNEPVPLEQIPPLVLSEVLRDVDLFVGVASVGNDPNWNDGGPEGRYREYWHETSFGDLSATAQTRREILERLVPRLKIADRCSFDEKFLIVRGDKRTYKIHLGSSNILMEPNDQYLCIVPGRGAGPGDKVFLPFEGDQRLAVILSKAMMLAEDTKIKDSTILSQIGG